MATLVTKSATVAENLASAYPGAANWQSPSSALTSNNLYTFNEFGGIGAGSGNKATHYLYLHDFGFALPTNAVVQGIEAIVERQAAGIVQDYYVALVFGSSQLTGPGKQKPDAWPAGDASASYGGESDLWNKVWTYSDVNATSFGFALSALGDPSLGATATIDHIYLNVSYYHLHEETVTGGGSMGGTADVTWEVNSTTLGGGAALAGHGGTDQSETASGGAVAGGIASAAHSYYGVGGATVNGSTGFGLTYRHTVTGSIRAGTSAEQTIVDVVPQGGQGAKAAGTAIVLKSFHATGGSSGGGSLESSFTYNITPTGGAKLAPLSFVHPVIATGGAGLGTAAVFDFNYAQLDTASGGLKAAGVARVVSYMTTDGGVSLGGSAVDTVSAATPITGGAKAAGIALIVPYFEFGSGGASLGSSAAVFPWITESGSVQLGGSAEIATVLNPHIADDEYETNCLAAKNIPLTGSSSDILFAKFRLDTVNSELHYNIVHTLATPLSQYSFNLRGPASKSETALTNFSINLIQSITSPVIGFVSLTSGQVTEIQDGLWYLYIRNNVSGLRLRGQIVNDDALGGGTARVFSVRTEGGSTGGIKAGGVAFVGESDVVPTTGGGVTLGGSYVLYESLAVNGGATMAGSADVDYNVVGPVEDGGGVVNGSSAIDSIYVPDIVSAGAVAGGTTVVVIEPKVSGGMVAGGATTPQYFFGWVPVGGARAGGSYVLQQNYNSLRFLGGVRVSGKARSERLTQKVQYTHNGYCRAMKSLNICTAIPENPNKLMNPVIMPAEPLSELRFRIQHNPEWCDFQDPCTKGAYLAPIMKGRQNPYLPPKKRTPSRKDRRIATMNGPVEDT